MLNHITFTGWDRHTDLHDLEEFCGDHEQECIEIAVLYSDSRSKDDVDRYPQLETAVEILRTARASGQRAAVHLCGQAARAFLEDPSESNAAPLIALANRAQVNVPEEFWASGPEKYRPALAAARSGWQRPVIVQTRDAARWPDVSHLEHPVRNAARMVPFLFDRSAGTGERSLVWPAPVPGRLVGYAGGIGPDNAAEFCSWLAEAAGARWWLDMETRIREPFPRQLVLRAADDPPTPSYVSIAKCRAVMAACDRWFRREGT